MNKYLQESRFDTGLIPGRVDTGPSEQQNEQPVPQKVGEPLDAATLHTTANLALQGFIENSELGGARF
jgi:hypothetical protein